MSSYSKQPPAFPSDSLFRRNADSAHYAIIVFEGEQVQYINPALSRLSGYSLQTLRKWKPDDFRARVIEEYQSGVTKFISDLFGGKTQHSRFEFQYKRRSGEIRWVDTIGNIVEVEGKRLVHLVMVDITDRKVAELRYQSLVESLPIGLFRTTPKGQIIEVNPTLMQMLHFPDKETALAENVVEYYVDSTARGHLQKRLEKQGVVQGYETRLRRYDGQILWVRISSRAIMDKQGRIQFYEGTLEDITDRRRAEEAYQLVVDQSLLGLTIFQEGGFVFMNKFFEDLLGYSIDELLRFSPEKIWEIVHPEDREEVMEHARKTLVGETITPRITLRVFRKDDEMRWIEASSHRIEYQNKPSALISMIDITERKQAEEAYRAVVEHSLQGYFILQDNLVVFTNPAGAEITGYSVEELLALPPEKVRDLVYSEDQLETWGRLRDRLAGKPVPDRYKIRFLRKDGSVRWIELISTIIEYQGRPAVQVSVIDITEQREVEEALRESEAKYRSFMENFQGIAYRALVDGAPEFFHGAVEPITGYTSEDFVSGWVQWHNIIHHEDWLRLKPEWGRVGSVSGAISEREYRIIRKDGTIRWLRENIHSFSDEKSKDIMVEGILIDITTGKLAERELQESQERFKQFFENNPSYCYMISRDGKILDVNDAALNVLGYQKTELVGKPLSTIYASESLPKMKELQIQWRLTGQLRDEELVIISKSAVRRTVLLSADAIRNREGKILHSVSVQQDITDLKRAEWELQERLKELACLFGISLLSDTPSLDISEFIGGVVGLLPPAWQYPDITCARIIVDDQEATTPNFRESPWKQSADITLHGERVGVIEVYYLEEKPDFDEGPFLKEERDLLNAVAERTSTTITLKQAGMALEESRARVEFFNDLMAHDLNNINQGLMLILELLLRNPALPEQLREQVTTALEQVARSVALIKRVKQFTHIDTLTQPLSKQDVVPFLRAATRSVTQAFPHKNLRMEGRLQKGRHWIAADDFLTDLFYNLLHNAMKYDPKDTVIVEVEIRSSEEEGFLRIEIKDHGSGIPDIEKERIFARFTKDPARRWIKGSGVGLTLVQRVIQRYGGKIWVEDRVPGDHTQGTNFVILLSKW